MPLTLNVSTGEWEEFTRPYESIQDLIKQSPDLRRDTAGDYYGLLAHAIRSGQYLPQDGSAFGVRVGSNELWTLDPVTKQVYRSGEIQPGVPWGASPSSANPTDEEWLQIAAMAAGAFGGGAYFGGAEAAGAGGMAAGDAAIAGGVGTSELAGGGATLGGGLSAGSTATGIGGGATGTGLTAGSTAGGIGGGAVGTGVTGAGAGALAPGYFAAESLPVLAGGAAGGASVLSGAGATGAAASGVGSILSDPKLLGAGLGAASSLLGGGSKPAGSTTTVQDIPEWLKPYATQGLGGMMNAYNNTPDGVAPVTAAGNQYMQDVIGGDYLNSNPYLDAMFNRAAGQVGAKVNSQFSGAGRYGSGAHTGVLTEGLGNLATDIYGGNYTRERQNQQQAAAASPAFGNSIISQPFLKGQNLLQGVNSIKGGTTSTPYFQNQFGDILGGALGGMALGKLFQ